MALGAKEQAKLNEQLDLSKKLQREINELARDQAGAFNDIKKVTADMGANAAAYLDEMAEAGKATKYTGQRTTELQATMKNMVENIDDLVAGNADFLESTESLEKTMGNLSSDHLKAGLKESYEYAIGLQKTLAHPKTKQAFESIDKGASKFSGMISNMPGGGMMNDVFGLDDKVGKSAAKLKENLVSTGAKIKSGKMKPSQIFTKKGLGGLLKGTNLLKIGLAGAALAALQFGLEANKLQKELGVAYGESAKILATSKSIALVNKANGMTQEETLAIMKNIASEFGSFDDATAGATLKASNLVANYGLATDSVGTLARQMQAVGAHSLDSALNSIELQANMARAAGVPVGEVMNDVAKSTGFFAAYAKDGGTNIVAAAISAKKLGLEMASIASIADSLLDFEDSITKQMEAEVLLGRELNLEKAREMIFNNDIAGAIAEVSKLVSPEEFARMDAVRRKSLAAAVGIDVATFSKAISGNVEDAVIDPSGRIISTAPEDYLIATKNPSMLGAATAAAGTTPQIEVGGLEAKLDTLIRATTDGQDGIKRSVQQMGVS
jgi:hypothetical protein